MVREEGFALRLLPHVEALVARLGLVLLQEASAGILSLVLFYRAFDVLPGVACVYEACLRHLSVTLAVTLLVQQQSLCLVDFLRDLTVFFEGLVSVASFILPSVAQIFPRGRQLCGLANLGLSCRVLATAAVVVVLDFAHPIQLFKL